MSRMTDAARDPLGRLAELRRALADRGLDEFAGPSPVGPEGRRAACRWAIARGFCHLFDAPIPPDIDATLPTAQATAAAEFGAAMLERWRARAATLGQRWDEATAVEGELLCADALQCRMQAWALWLALDEAYETATARSSPELERLEEAIDALAKSLDAFDLALQTPENLAILSVVCETELLDNWRQFLAAEHADPLPWWLDGVLEAWAGLPEPSISPRLEAREQTQTRPAGALGQALDRMEHSLAPQYSVAAKDADDRPPVEDIVQWRSPDEKRFAVLLCPVRPHAGQQIYLRCLDAASGKDAVEMAGLAVRLAGVAGRLDDRARAVFLLDDLLQSPARLGGDAALVVGDGSEAVLWEELPSEIFEEDEP